MNAKQITGRSGEDAACLHLQSMGMTILARNYRSGHYELDIVAFDPLGVHIVEVRTRLGEGLVPGNSVDSLKQKKVIAGARRFLLEHPELSQYELFFDIVGVTVAGKKIELEYTPNAYIPIYV